jgi:hypothetical protein
MRRPITFIAVALASAIAAAPAHAGPPPSAEQQKDIKAVVVLIGANDYGLTAPVPAPAAE